jgi:hypothetical protein
MEKKPDGRYAYIAPYYAQAKNIAWDYLLKFAEPAIVKANQSELWVELVNGAKIRLFGADNPDALRGLYLDGVVLDEYADMKPRLWGEIVRPLLTDRNKAGLPLLVRQKAITPSTTYTTKPKRTPIGMSRPYGQISQA